MRGGGRRIEAPSRAILSLQPILFFFDFSILGESFPSSLKDEGGQSDGCDDRNGGQERGARGGLGGALDAVVGVAFGGGGGLASLNVVLLRVAQLPHPVLDVAVKSPIQDQGPSRDENRKQKYTTATTITRGISPSPTAYCISSELAERGKEKRGEGGGECVYIHFHIIFIHNHPIGFVLFPPFT